VVRYHTLAAVTVGAQPNVPMTPSSVAEAFDELVSDPGYRKRAWEFKRSLDALPTMAFAVHLLERLASTRAPVMRAA
jgi:hypothetical protein